jgi:hypothetical protein
MAIIIKQFDSYKIEYRSVATQIAGQAQPISKNSAVVFCSFSGQLLGILLFQDTDFLPKNSIDNQSQIVTIRFNRSLFRDIIDILRYEKPLYLYLNTADWHGGIQNKEVEPVGEEESL